MKRKSTDDISMVYAYGIGEIVSGLEHAYAEQAKCRVFWDRLVDIDRQHEVDILRAATEADERLTFLRDEVHFAGRAVRDAIDARAAERKRLRTNKVAASFDEAVTTEAARHKAARKEFFERISAWRKAHPDDVRALVSAKFDAIKEARISSGLLWCNYNRVVQSFDASRTRCLKQGLRLRYSDKERSDGCLTVQIQRTRSGLGAAPKELQDGSLSALQIGLVPAAAYDKEATPRCERSRLCQTTMQMRVDAEGHPITAKVWMHRPLPADCRVKSAQITWRDGGARGRQWQLALTISIPKRPLAHERPKEVVGIDVGWRIKPDGGLRVAYWYGSDGEQGELVLPARMMAHMDWVEQTQADIDNEIIYGEDEIRKAHMRIMGGRRKDLGERREMYRLFARQIAKQYGIVAVENIDLASIAADRSQHAGRAQRQRAGVHRLLAEIKHQCAKHGAALVPMDGPSTMQCHHCGKIGEPSRREDLSWTCDGCDAIWDQDQGAAISLMLSAAEGASAQVTFNGRSYQNKVLPASGKPQKRTARKAPRETAGINEFA